LPEDKRIQNLSDTDDELKNDDQAAPPPGMAAMHSLAVGYGQYVSYLKSGGESGISDVFGRISFKEASQRLIAVSQRMSTISRQLEVQESARDSSQEAEAVAEKSATSPDVRDSMTMEDKLGAVFGLFSGALSVQDVCQTYEVSEPTVRKWLEAACRGMEAALREDNS
jgi:hypothetical protein